MSDRDEALDPIFKALSDPTRREILDLLNTQARTTGEVAASFKLSRFAVMKHLGVLEKAGLITVRREGRERWNHLNAAPLAQVYERWVSRQTAWAPTLEGTRASAPTPEPLGTASETDGERLKEIYLIVRPEERYPVERAVQTVVPPLYSVMNATGRGAYWESKQTPDTRWSWRRREQLSQFLPKTILFMVVPESYVATILSAVAAALRFEGGPEDCGTGFAAVLDAGEEIVIGAGRADPQTRATAEGWASRE